MLFFRNVSSRHNHNSLRPRASKNPKHSLIFHPFHATPSNVSAIKMKSRRSSVATILFGSVARRIFAVTAEKLQREKNDEGRGVSLTSSLCFKPATRVCYTSLGKSQLSTLHIQEIFNGGLFFIEVKGRGPCTCKEVEMSDVRFLLFLRGNKKKNCHVVNVSVKFIERDSEIFRLSRRELRDN